jgi:hypothetical protein
MVIVGGNRGDLSVRHCYLRVERGELQMLLVLLWAVVATRKGEDQRIIALQLAELAQFARVIRQLVVGKTPPGAMSGRMFELLRWDRAHRLF